MLQPGVVVSCSRYVSLACCYGLTATLFIKSVKFHCAVGRSSTLPYICNISWLLSCLQIWLFAACRQHQSDLHLTATTRRTMSLLKTDDSVSVSLSRARLNEQQMDCLYNILFYRLSVFTLIPPSVYPLIFFTPLSFFLSSLLPSPSVRFSLHFVTRITLLLRHLFLCVSSVRPLCRSCWVDPASLFVSCGIVSTCCKLRAASDWARSRSPCVHDLGITAGPERCQRQHNASSVTLSGLAGVRWKYY